jgi:hypothetical protein
VQVEVHKCRWVLLPPLLLPHAPLKCLFAQPAAHPLALPLAVLPLEVAAVVRLLLLFLFFLWAP